MVLKVILLQGQRGRAVGKVGCHDHRVTMAQVRGAVTVMALLGITWVSGALAIGPLKLVLKYVFCISNSLQGFIIFIVRVVQYPEARLSWTTLLNTGQTQIRYQDGTRIHSTGPATHSSSHSQMRQTLSCSTQSTGQSNSNGSDSHKSSSVNVIGTFSSVRTRIRIAVVDIRFAVDSRVPRQAMASEIASG